MGVKLAKMSLKKKDPSAPGGLRVAANDPHLVSLGGGRLSTAVTIHYLPIGSMTIGSSPSCSISLNGTGVQPHHCTLYRSDDDDGKVTIVPENDARVLIDGNKITTETNLTQGAMLTIGNSNYLRFNNPAEAQMIKSTMGSNERISMPQIDFTQDRQNDSTNNSSTITTTTRGSILNNALKNLNKPYDTHIIQKTNNETILDKVAKVEYININNFHSPKVFAADSVTVNTPAKDVLGPKYANFAKNLATNHKNDKNFCTKNNEMSFKTGNYANVPSSFIQNSPNSNPASNEILTKVNNSNYSCTTRLNSSVQQVSAASTYDRYPKIGGGLQLFPMNGVNSEINIEKSDCEQQNCCEYPSENNKMSSTTQKTISAQEQERLDEILKICTEYERQQNQNVQSSPIVQNRIKTNGSLPREKKSPFFDHNSQTGHSKVFFPEKTKSPSTAATNTYSGYENVRVIGDRRIEIGSPNFYKNSSGYENVIIGKYIPQSPRTKIRTTCTSPSPKKDIPASVPVITPSYHNNRSNNHQTNEYAHLIQTFEEKLKMEMQAIQEATKAKEKQAMSRTDSFKKRQNLNINNLTLNLSSSTINSNNESSIKDATLAEGNATVNSKQLVDLKSDRENVLSNIRKLKTQIAEIQRQEDEVLRELDLEKALVSAEMSTVNVSLVEMENNFLSLQTKIHRLEAQRNANRVMQETQQAKLKQSIEVKQEQVSALHKLVKENETDESLKEEYEKNLESLENDRKTFEDLEFQYLEEETDWIAYREELHTELKNLSKQIEEKQLQMLHLQSQGIENQNSACTDTKTLENNLLSLLTDLERSREELQSIDKRIFEITGQQFQSQSTHQNQSDSDDDEIDLRKTNGNGLNTIMSQSLFGSTEILSAKPKDMNLMSKSVNENMFFNNIEMPTQKMNGPSTSTPKKELTVVEITEDLDSNKNDVPQEKTNDTKDRDKTVKIIPAMVRRDSNDEKDPILKLKYNVQVQNDDAQKSNLNLSLEGDDFEVNPLDKRIPSQDDIDRICKVTLDAPISTTKGASSKIIESIKEIERNRQLLLAQQGSHVIEHERQKMQELKKKSHDEARAQYLSSQNIVQQISSDNKLKADNTSDDKQNDEVTLVGDKMKCTTPLIKSENHQTLQESEQKASQQRHSHPELESQRTRPLSDANSEINYENLKEKQFKSNNDISVVTGGGTALSLSRYSENSDDAKRSSLNSNNTLDDDRPSSSIGNNKRSLLPKHQRPLTRYLPIMSPDLDLRQHIESAGHQIALCPHVIIDSYSCRGYLHKLGATFHGWSRRWFVLDRQRNAFIYYSDRSERKPRGGAYFSTIDEVYLDHLNTSKSGRPHCTFIVKTKRRSYHLQAASDAAARIWIDAIITGAQGNIDY